MRIWGEVIGICPYCHEAVIKREKHKFVWKRMWRVAHLECEDNHTPMNEPEIFVE